MIETIKVLTYNIHRNRSPFQSRDIHDRILSLLQKEQADIICLQEVWGQTEEIEPRIITALTNFTWDKRAYGKNAVFPEGHQGNAILCRLEVLEWHNIDISYPPLESRGFLILRSHSQHHNIPLWVVCLHFGLKRQERQSQFQALSRYIEAHIPDHHPLIIAGDFNDWRGQMTKELQQSLDLNDAAAYHRQMRTFPACFPLLTIDRILYRNCRCVAARACRSAKRIGLSDHVPIEATFELKPGPTNASVVSK